MEHLNTTNTPQQLLQPMVEDTMQHCLNDFFVDVPPPPPAQSSGSVFGNESLFLNNGNQSLLISSSDYDSVVDMAAEVDTDQISIQKSKKALTYKLAQRRSQQELINCGYLPSSKVPILHYDQMKHLEKAQLQDFLRTKIEKRPKREYLEQKNILLADSNVAPSLQLKRNQLKRARLADDLNKKLAKRPGPLELLESGILKSDTKIVEAIKDGKIAYARTTRNTSNNDNNNAGSSSHSPASSYGDFSFSASVNSNSSRSSSQYLDVASSEPTTSTENGSNGSNSPTNYMAFGFTPAESKTKSFSSKQTLNSKPFSPACSSSSTTKSNSSQTAAPVSTTTKKLIFHEYRGPNQKPNKTVSIQPITTKRTTATTTKPPPSKPQPPPPISNEESIRKSSSFTNYMTTAPASVSTTKSPMSATLTEISMQLDTTLDDSTLLSSHDSAYQKCLEQQEKYLSFIDELSQNTTSQKLQQQENEPLFPSSNGTGGAISSDLQHFENIRNLINTKLSSLTSVDDDVAEMPLAASNGGGSVASFSEKELSEMSIKELKDECRRRNLLLKGNKNHLVERLIASLNGSNSASPKPAESSETTNNGITFASEQPQQQVATNTTLQLTQDQFEKLFAAANPNMQINLEPFNAENTTSSVLNVEPQPPQPQIDPAIEHLEQLKKSMEQKMQLIEKQMNQLRKSQQQQAPQQPQQWQQQSQIELNKVEFFNNANKRQASMPSSLNNFATIVQGNGQQQPVFHQENMFNDMTKQNSNITPCLIQIIPFTQTNDEKMSMQQQQQKATVYEFETLKKELVNSTLAAAAANTNGVNNSIANNDIDIDWNCIDFQMYQDMDASHGNSSTSATNNNQQTFNVYSSNNSHSSSSHQQQQPFTFINEPSNNATMLINPSNVIMTNTNNDSTTINNIESNKPVFFLDSNVLWEYDSEMSQNVGGFLQSPTV